MLLWTTQNIQKILIKNRAFAGAHRRPEVDDLSLPRGNRELLRKNKAGYPVVLFEMPFRKRRTFGYQYALYTFMDGLMDNLL